MLEFCISTLVSTRKAAALVPAMHSVTAQALPVIQGDLQAHAVPRRHPPSSSSPVARHQRLLSPSPAHAPWASCSSRRAQGGGGRVGSTSARPAMSGRRGEGAASSVGITELLGNDSRPLIHARAAPWLSPRASAPRRPANGARCGKAPRALTHDPHASLLFSFLLQYLSGDKIYTCSQCKTHCTDHSQLISKVGVGVRGAHRTTTPSSHRAALSKSAHRLLVPICCACSRPSKGDTAAPTSFQMCECLRRHAGRSRLRSRLLCCLNPASVVRPHLPPPACLLTCPHRLPPHASRPSLPRLPPSACPGLQREHHSWAARGPDADHRPAHGGRHL